MRVAIAGGGPGGLYLASLLKRDHPSWPVAVFERDGEDATFGFGVVFSDRALDFLRDADAETWRLLAPHMQAWPDLRITHRDRGVDIDGNGFAAIGRLALLTLLRADCRERGVDLAFGHPVDGPEALADAELIVAADGANSSLRAALAGELGFTQSPIGNKYIWYGTAKPFDCLSLTFREGPDGVFCAHHYRYAPDASTFIVECDDQTFVRARLGEMSDAESRAMCEAVFAADLDGHSLLSNRSAWRDFNAVANARWRAGKVVLMGDALRMVHFSIGSGTRLAMEDALALAKALGQHDTVAAAAAAYEAARRPAVARITAAAAASAAWYRAMAANMAAHDALDFAYSYMTRTGRMDDSRLAAIAPRFAAAHRAHRAAGA